MMKTQFLRIILIIMFPVVSYAQTGVRVYTGTQPYGAISVIAAPTDGKPVFISGSDLFKSDGTVAGTQRIMTLPGTVASSVGNTIETMLAVGNTVYFRINASDGSAKLWKTDGTSQGTVPVKTPTGPPPGTVTRMAALGNSLLFFAATDTTVGNNKISNFAPHLWRTDGTDTGTTLISTNIGVVSALYSTDSLFVFSIGNANAYKDYLSINDYGGGIYRTDGSVSGTKRITSLPTERSGLRAANIQAIQAQKDAFYISNNEDIWRLGYRVGSTPQLVQGVSTGETNYLVGSVGEKTFVQKNRKSAGKDDGVDLMLFSNASAAPALINSFTGTNAMSVYYNIAMPFKNKLFFAGKNTSNGNINPWISDGTATGTFMLKNVDYSTNAGIIGDNAYFLSTRPSVGTAPIIADMYQTDGTVTNTQATSFSINSGLGQNYLIASKDKVFFSIRNSSTINNEEVWTYNPAIKSNGCNLTTSINSTQSFSFCSSGGTTLTANPANGTSPYQYRWAKDNSPISTTSASLNATVGGIYFLTITDACSPASIASVTLTAVESPTVTVEGGLVSCTGKPTALTAVVKGGTAPYLYNWVIDGTSAATTPVFSTTATNFYYQVYVTSANRCVGSSAYLSLNATYKPLTAAITGSTTMCTGQPATLTASLTGGTAPYTYQWKQNGTVVGTNAASLSISTGGTYSLSVTDACSSTTASFSVSAVACVVPTILLPAGVATATTPITMTASTGLTGGADAGATFQWLLNGNPIAGAVSPTYSTSISGSYAVAVTLSGRVTTSPAVTLTINVVLATEPLGLTENQVTVYPNPTTGECWVLVDMAMRQTATLSLTDALGKTVRQWKAPVGPKMQPLRITLPDTDGLYFLRTETEQGVVVKKIVRSR